MIADAITGSTSMRLLDLSFNGVCGNGKDANNSDEEKTKRKSQTKKPAKNQAGMGGMPGGFYEEYAEKWSHMFMKNKSLVHVDLSHNKIKEVDCEIIAEGLKRNHFVLGLHFQGNFGSIDHLGFMESYMPASVGD